MISLPFDEIVLASANQGKISEIKALLGGCRILPQSQFNVVEVEETGLTFVENAIIKARNAAKCTGLPAIADDSGLVVDALNGAPGILSARYAGEGASDQENNDKLLKELETTPDSERSARFICVIALMKHALDPMPILAQGIWEGKILFQPKGRHGFGYDPVFWASSENCASAELPPEIKNTISHRGKALRNLGLSLSERHFLVGKGPI
ncbi:MAG: RdgB/HAM1 family non-canonical purine NTP pyrophosphatase [Gammaproteobacteria bacterium]